ncbi:hypothetical protein H4J02_10070 [Protaetiibacter sp. SSC-01]|uniref:hypothetical protein n=1 Tax=Protaetiibacter sp. SSC-01 TaxID=2759943 RepID=UPI0016569EAB|nr:hypothetical protein [Protaetiibacter sp. SSC-01]QNO36822.1 hypothetical protein H4J02_10070 [Protaetiibacter sp. SSC-01]
MTDAARAAVDRVVAALSAADAPTEQRVEIVQRRFRGTRMVVAGDVWRLGAVCADASGALFATGEVLVVARPTHPNHRSATALRRNELRQLAAKSGIRDGSTVVLDARPLDLAAPEAPLVATDAGVAVEWTPGAVPAPLEGYLTERAELLLHPPRGAAD